MSDLDAIKFLLDGSYRGAESKFKNQIKSLKQENEILKNCVADLEAKLAESEKQNKRLYNENESAERILRMSSDEQTREIKRLQNELSSKVDYIHELVEVKDDYKQQLAEKDKEIKELLNYDRCSHCSYGQANKEYREKCSELIEELAEVKNSCDYYMNRANDLLLKDQDKISFSVEQLEKVKEHFINIKTPTLGVIRRSEMVMYIDNQIKQLNASNSMPLGDKGE